MKSGLWAYQTGRTIPGSSLPPGVELPEGMQLPPGMSLPEMTRKMRGRYVGSCPR